MDRIFKGSFTYRPNNTSLGNEKHLEIPYCNAGRIWITTKWESDQSNSFYMLPWDRTGFGGVGVFLWFVLKIWLLSCWRLLICLCVFTVTPLAFAPLGSWVGVCVCESSDLWLQWACLQKEWNLYGVVTPLHAQDNGLLLLPLPCFTRKYNSPLSSLLVTLICWLKLWTRRHIPNPTCIESSAWIIPSFYCLETINTLMNMWVVISGAGAFCWAKFKEPTPKFLWFFCSLDKALI